MQRRVIWSSLVLIGLLLFQFSYSRMPLVISPPQEEEVTRFELPPPDIALNTQVTCILNHTSENPLFNVPIIDPGLYLFNMTFTVDQADPWSGVGLYLHLYDSASYTDPYLTASRPIDRELDNNIWWGLLTGSSDRHYTEFMVVQAGSAIVEFELYWSTPWDQLTVNFTISQQYSFADALLAPLDQNMTIQWREDNSWNITRITIPSDDLYNITLYSSVPYSTTAGWPGDPTFTIFNPVVLFDLVYGARVPYSQWNPICDIPHGPATGTATWSESRITTLLAGDYYLLCKSNPFIFLNGTYLNLTTYVEQIPSIPLGADESINLSFDISTPTNNAFVAVTVPTGFMTDFYFSDPVGGNWSIIAYDALSSMLVVPTFNYYEDPTANVTVETRYHTAVSLLQPGPSLAPLSGLTGEEYFEPYSFSGIEVLYLNGVPQSASYPPSGGTMAFWNTFYFIVQAYPGWMGPPSSTFNLNLSLDTTPIPQLDTTTDLILPLNNTIGPFYHGFLLPVESGVTYEISATPTKYTTNGLVLLELLSLEGQFYREWGFMSYYPLFKAVGISGLIGVGSPVTYNVNETTTLSFMSVRNTTMLVIVIGSHPMIGLSDTTEIELSLSITNPTDYILGSEHNLVSPTTAPDFTGFNVQLTEGYSYRIHLSIDHGSIGAVGTFFDDEGHTPFDITTHDQLIIVEHTWAMDFNSTFTATHTGTVTFAMIHKGNASFSIDLIDDKPPNVNIIEPEWGASFEQKDIVINFTATDEIGLASLVAGIDGVEASIPIDSVSYTLTGLEPGIHLCYIRAVDTQGNVATDSVAILILPDPLSWELGQNAAYAFFIPVAIGGVVITGVIGFVFGWLIKGRRKSL